MIDFCKKEGPGSRGGQAGEADRFLATLKRMAQVGTLLLTSLQ